MADLPRATAEPMEEYMYPEMAATARCFPRQQTMRLLLLAWTLFVPLRFFASIFHFLLGLADATLTLLLALSCASSLLIGGLGILQQYRFPQLRALSIIFLVLFGLDALYGAVCFIIQVQDPLFVWSTILFGVHVPLQIYLLVFFAIDFKNQFADFEEQNEEEPLL